MGLVKKMIIVSIQMLHLSGCGVISLDCEGVYLGIMACLSTAKLGGAGTLDLAERTTSECQEINKSGKATEQDEKKYKCFQKLTNTQCADPTTAVASLGSCGN